MATTQPAASFGQRDDTALLVLKGPIRHPHARALRALVDDEVLAGGADTVFIDVSEVADIDSTGMGLLARIGRNTIERHGRRAVLVCPPTDVATTLRSASFDQMFQMVDAMPFDPEVELKDVPLALQGGLPLGDVVLDAHRELAGTNEKNRAAYGELLSLLEAELSGSRR